MEVEIWSDVTCPFCYIGKENFKAALRQFPHRTEIEVHWRSFELDPNATHAYPGSLYEWLSKRYGRSIADVKEMNRPVIRQANSLGLKFNLDVVKPTNSFDAHRLIKLAQVSHKADEVINKIFEAYFSEGKNISDKKVLLEIGVSRGIDKNDISSMLSSDGFSAEVRADEEEARRLSIRGVPYFLFNRSQYLAGSNPASVFLKVLSDLWLEKSLPGTP